MMTRKNPDKFFFSLMSKSCFMLMILAAVMLAGISWAGPGVSAQLDEITVTAERFPVAEMESSRSVTVISSKQLKQTGGNNLADALSRISGLAYSSKAPLGLSHGGMNSSLGIRGVKDAELILINGMPIQSPASHAYDLSTISPDQIERVEILKGAASTLYGADAMSGVINIITKKPMEKKSISGSVEFGNRGYHHHGISAFSPGASIGFTYQHLGRQEKISRSFSRNYKYDIETTDLYSLNANARIAENLWVDYLGSFYNTGFQKHYDDPGTPYEATQQDNYKNFASLRYENTNLRIKGFGTFDKMERKEYTMPGAAVDKNKNYNYGLQADFQQCFFGWNFQAGADWTYRGADYNNQYGRHYRNDYAFFLQGKKQIARKIYATLGARQQFIDSESKARDHDQFLPSLGISYMAAGNINFFANAGKAFRVPTFNNLYYESSFMNGNPDLSPEKGWTWEGGVKYTKETIKVRLSAFFMSYEDKIELDRSRGYPLTYFNAGDYESKGIEWEIDIYPFIKNHGWTRNLFFSAAGCWADPTAEDTNGRHYQTGPKFNSSGAIHYSDGPLSMDLRCQLLGSRERNLDSTTVFHFYSRHQLWKGFLTFAVDNIFNREIHLSGDLTDTSSNQYVYYDLGRLIKIGYEIKF